MAEANDTFGRLYQNLIDAGCSAETVAQCMELAKRGNTPAVLAALNLSLIHI